MRKIHQVFFAALISLGAQAQTLRNQHVITTGAGYSAVGFAFTAMKEVLNTSGAVIRINSTPVAFGAYDFGLDDYVSLGISYTFQSFDFNYDRYTPDSGVVIKGDFTDNVIRQNFALRPLVHLGFNEKTDFYFGGRVGYTKWTFTSASGLNYTAEQYFGDKAAFQGLIGIRYYPRRNFGLNAEVALGPPYIGMFGLNFRFGGKEQ